MADRPLALDPLPRQPLPASFIGAEALRDENDVKSVVNPDGA